MGDVQARTGPLGEGDGAADGFDFAHFGPCGEVGVAVGAAGGVHALLAARHDRGVLGMHDATHAAPRQDFEAFEHRAIGRRRQIAEGVAHETLEAGGAGVDQGVELVDVVFVEQGMDAEVDMRD